MLLRHMQLKAAKRFAGRLLYPNLPLHAQGLELIQASPPRRL